MAFSPNKYPEILNPYQILGIQPYFCNISIAKQNFKIKMHGNENPDIRLAYDMLVNPNDYCQINTMVYSVINKDIFYYAHVGGLDEIKIYINRDNKLLYSKDHLGRTIFYLAARNGYYSLCKYLLDKGAIINDSQQHGNTPLESAFFYGHNSIVQLIKEYETKQMKYLKYIKNMNKNYTIKDFDEIIKNNSDKHYKHHSNFFNFIKINPLYPVFNNISIFDKEKYDFRKKQFYSNYSKNLTKLEKSCIGAMLGMAIGDAMGARVEFQPLNYNFNDIKDMGYNPAGKFKLKPGQWTDDTSLGLCLADSLIENDGKFDGHDLMIRFILWWFYGYNNCFRFDEDRPYKQSIGLGGNVAESFKKYISEMGNNEFTKSGNEGTSGNGSIIRNAPIPICFYNDMELALEMSEKQSKVTHQGNQAAGCCQLLTFITVKILNGGNLKDILCNLQKDFACKYKSVNHLAYSMQEDNDPNKNWNWNQPKYEYSCERVKSNPGYIGSYAMDAMSMALHILINTNSFADAILKGVNLRGDADSVGAVIGQIAGAYYGIDGIPKEWIQKIYDWDKQKEIALRGYILCHLGEQIK